MSNAVMKRTFRASATIAGLIQRNTPAARKNGRQATFSSDILYDTLVKYDPDHLLLDITRAEAMRGLVDFGRIEEMLDRVAGRITLRRLTRVSPLAAPLFLEAGRMPVEGRTGASARRGKRAADGGRGAERDRCGRVPSQAGDDVMSAAPDPGWAIATPVSGAPQGPDVVTAGHFANAAPRGRRVNSAARACSP